MDKTLNLLRTGQATDSDIALLSSRCITKLSKHYPHNACHIFFTNEEVDDHNTEKLNKIISTLYQIKLVGDYPKNYKPKITPYGTVDDTNLYDVLKIKMQHYLM